MGKLTPSRLQAQTLIETLVAMVIITIVFGIATTIFVTLTSTVSEKKIKSQNLLREFSTSTVRENNFFKSEQQEDEFLLKREVIELNREKTLFKIHYYVYDANQLLLDDWEQLVCSENN